MTTEPQKESISESLKGLLHGEGERAPTLGEIVKLLENKGFGLLFIILALPSALPVPAAGYSTPFGIVIFLLGWQLLAGRSSPWVPPRLQQIRMSRKMTERVSGGGTHFFSKLERLVRPRLQWLHTGLGRIALALLIMLMALLMCLPIPTTNTFPAIVIFLVGVSLAEEDGLFGLGAALAGLLAVAIYAIPLYLLVPFISAYGLAGGFEEITARMAEWKEAIKAWVKGIF